MVYPDHYRPFFRLFLGFGLVMLVFGGLAGVLFQEMTGKVKYETLEPGIRFEAFYRLAIVHGHSFLVGFLMPVAWLSVLTIALRMGARPLSAKTLRWIAWTYIPGAISVVGLVLYKGMVYVTRVKEGETDFDAIHQSLFWGSRAIRGIVYGTSHTVATIGLVIFAVAVWRSLGRDDD